MRKTKEKLNRKKKRKKPTPVPKKEPRESNNSSKLGESPNKPIVVVDLQEQDPIDYQQNQSS